MFVVPVAVYVVMLSLLLVLFVVHHISIVELIGLSLPPHFMYLIWLAGWFVGKRKRDGRRVIDPDT